MQRGKKNDPECEVSEMEGGLGQVAPRAQVGSGPVVGGRLGSLWRKIRMVKFKGCLQRWQQTDRAYTSGGFYSVCEVGCLVICQDDGGGVGIWDRGEVMLEMIVWRVRE